MNLNNIQFIYENNISKFKQDNKINDLVDVNYITKPNIERQDDKIETIEQAKIFAKHIQNNSNNIDYIKSVFDNKIINVYKGTIWYSYIDIYLLLNYKQSNNIIICKVITKVDDNKENIEQIKIELDNFHIDYVNIYSSLVHFILRKHKQI